MEVWISSSLVRQAWRKRTQVNVRQRRKQLKFLINLLISRQFQLRLDDLQWYLQRKTLRRTSVKTLPRIYYIFKLAPALPPSSLSLHLPDKVFHNLIVLKISVQVFAFLTANKGIVWFWVLYFYIKIFIQFIKNLNRGRRGKVFT